MNREDDNPYFGTGRWHRSTVSNAFMAELIALPRGDNGRWYGVALYNLVDLQDSREPLYHSLTMHVGHMIQTNIRAFIESTFHIEREENQLILGLMTAF
jgi:hypothetical protein